MYPHTYKPDDDSGGHYKLCWPPAPQDVHSSRAGTRENLREVWEVAGPSPTQAKVLDYRKASKLSTGRRRLHLCCSTLQVLKTEFWPPSCKRPIHKIVCLFHQSHPYPTLYSKFDKDITHLHSSGHCLQVEVRPFCRITVWEVSLDIWVQVVWFWDDGEINGTAISSAQQYRYSIWRTSTWQSGAMNYSLKNKRTEREAKGPLASREADQVSGRKKFRDKLH